MRDERKSERAIHGMFTDLQTVGLLRQFFCFMLITVFVTGCTKDEFQFNAETDILSVAGITGVLPINLNDSVAIDPIVRVTFKQGTDQSYVAKSASTLVVKKGINPVPGNTLVSGTTITFVPSADLAENTEYNATIVAIKKGSSGNSETHEYTWKFKTGKHHRNSSLSVISVEPQNKATTTPVNSKLVVTFNHELTTVLRNSVAFDLKNGTTTVTGALSFTEKTATFTPSASLAPNTVYNASIIYGKVPETDAENDDSNVEKTFSWIFTTVTDGGKDVTAPTVISAFPASNATSVAASSNFRVTFSEVMNASTITASTITLKKGSVAVAGTVSYTGTTATFTPLSALEDNTVYTGTVTTGVKDVAGNALAANFTTSFTSAAAISVDKTPPTIVSVNPGINATSVALNSVITANFSESMNPASITSSTFTLKQGTTVITGTVTYSGATAKFAPSAALAANTVYTVTVTTGAKDAAGNALAANYTWSFTTLVPVAALSFATDVVPVLNKCNTCHTHNWTTSSNTSTFYANLVSAGYVNAASPTTSKIYTKLNGGHPGSVVTAAEIAKILNWMSEGSKNN
jgi:hypothetical protein